MATEKAPVLLMHDNDTIKWTSNGVGYCAHIQQEDYPWNPRTEQDNIGTMVCFGRNRLGDRHDFKNPEDFWQKLVRDHVSYADIFAAARDGKISGIRLAQTGDIGGTVWDVYETSEYHTPIGKLEENEWLEYSGLIAEQVPYYIIDDLTVGNCMKLVEPYVAWLPLWVYEHSGITMSAGTRNPFTCRWDSGCVGWIYLTKDKAMAELCEYVTDENGERVRITHEHPDGSPTYSYQTRKLTDDTWRERVEEHLEAEVKVYDQYLTGEVYLFTLYEEKNDGGDSEWEEIETLGGFFGDDIIENGICDEIGNDLYEAIAAGEYELGEAVKHTVSFWSF